MKQGLHIGILVSAKGSVEKPLCMACRMVLLQNGYRRYRGQFDAPIMGGWVENLGSKPGGLKIQVWSWELTIVG